MLTRRQFTSAAVTLAAGSVLAAAAERPRYTTRLAPPADVGPGKTVQVRLTAAERPTALPCFGGRPLPMWTFTESAWPPVVRLDLGDELQATLENRLPRADETTSIHWHGIRLPNDQDGVPHLVQPPVNVGETFHYRFTPPDCGTYFFHTHCNTVEQLGRGLQGTLIIDGDAVDNYDADVVLLMRDWIIDADTGGFASFFTLRGAGRAGTYGSLRTVNGAVNPEIPLPAAGECRLRLINSDPTRIMKIGVKGAEAAIIAIDGIAVEPFPLTLWEMGPAMRIDLALRAPQEGGRASLVDISQSAPLELAHFASKGGRAARIEIQSSTASRRSDSRAGSQQRDAIEFHLRCQRKRPGAAARDRCTRGFAQQPMSQHEDVLDDQRAGLAGSEEPENPGAVRRAGSWCLVYLLHDKQIAVLAPDPRSRAHVQAAWLRQAAPAHASYGHPVVVTGRDGGGRFRRRQPRRLDVPLPCDRTSGNRNDGIFSGGLTSLLRSYQRALIASVSINDGG